MVSEIDSPSLYEQLQKKALSLIDVRTPAEVAQAAIPGAIHIPMHLLPLHVEELPKDKEIVLYCRSGARSYHACSYLMQQGIRNVMNLRGGIISWALHGFELQPGLQS